jgi:thioredoxin-like negative regulator of GroEL
MVSTKPSRPSSPSGVEISHHRAERFYLRLFLGGLIALIVAIALIRAMHGGYVQWQERRLVRQAVFALEHGDYRTASLAARSVLDMKPTSAPAARVLAELAERGGDRVALEWRRKIAQLEPDSTDDALAWARCALQFNDPATAERALATVKESSRQTAGYHAVVASLAQAQNDSAKAESEWTEAVRLAPNDKTYQLQLGIARIHSLDPERHASGETMLQQLRTDQNQRAAATRALIGEGTARHEDATKLLQLAHELQDYPEATPSDRILYLDFLHQLGAPEFTSYLTTLEKKVEANPADLVILLSWMSQNNLNVLALDFVKSLPAGMTEKWPTALAIAEIYERLADWPRLEAATKSANWQQYDFLRHAYLARALRAEDKPAAAEHEWAIATKNASTDGASLLTLVKAASQWKWTDETTDLLWALTKFPDKQNEALQTLYRVYRTNGDSQGLYRVLARLVEIDPENLDFKNNFAQLSLLLEANPDEARRLAAEAYRKVPSNAAYATTYAYALLTKRDTAAALKVMSALTPEQLQDPSISAYYGICLAADGNERAVAFLEAGKKAHLLPEEKALVDKAFTSLKARSEIR